MPTTTLDLLRHGQTTSTKRFGHPHERLTDAGRNQMWLGLGHVFPWQTVFTSPYARCTEIAQEVANRARLPLVELQELRSLEWGSWTDKENNEVMRTDPDALARFDADPYTHRATGGESLTDMANRSVQGCQAILQQAAGQHVLVIGHKWNIQAIVVRALGMPATSMYSIVCEHGSLTRLQFTGSGNRYLPGLVFHTGGAPRVLG